MSEHHVTPGFTAQVNHLTHRQPPGVSGRQTWGARMDGRVHVLALTGQEPGTVERVALCPLSRCM